MTVDYFPYRDYELPPGVNRHNDALTQDKYTDPALFAAEMDKIFSNDWITVGRVGQIPNPGNYFTAMVGRRPVIIMRQDTEPSTRWAIFACTVTRAYWKARAIRGALPASITTGPTCALVSLSGCQTVRDLSVTR